MSTPEEALLAVAQELWRSVLADTEPRRRALYERMKKPRPGDLVMETSAGAREPAKNRLGVYLRETHEPLPGWPLDDPDDPNPGERVYYLRNFEGTEVRWTNADLAALPPPPSPEARAAGWPQPGEW